MGAEGAVPGAGTAHTSAAAGVSKPREPAREGAAVFPPAARRSLRAARAAFEARHIAETLRELGGNVSRAAEALGLSRVMLQKKMKTYGLR